MEATVLDKEFNIVGVVDTYKSFIWTDRYDECGDFEIVTNVEELLSGKFQKGYYLWNAKSEHMMIIESIQITTDDEEGSALMVSGRSLESILDRRIVWNKKIFKMDEETFDKTGVIIKPKVQDALYEMIDENIINTTKNRKIPNFIFVKETEDEKVTTPDFEAEYLGDDLYSVVKTLCYEHEIGFKLTYHETYEYDGKTYENAFVFKLYSGTDRSYGDPDSDVEQTENPYVIFSPDYENLFNTNYIDSIEKLKNATLVIGEMRTNSQGEVEDRIAIEVTSGDDIYGLDRREAYTDATSTSMEDEYGGVLSPERYEAILRQKGYDTLIANTPNTAFEAEVDPEAMFVYGRDYFIGDIVQVVNEYGIEGRAYISEVIMSCDDSGTYMYPTFKIIEKGVYET